jgi:hypothetical protein
MTNAPQLKLFVVGPQGAGKTVFCTMLNQHVVHDTSLGLTFRAGNWATKQHFDDIQSDLRRRKWPGRTNTGSLPKLEWEWVFAGRTARFVLVDPSGEDIQDELSGHSSKLGIVDEIKNAHVLFVLIDLHGHQADDSTKRILNAWIIEHVLKFATSTYRVVVGISKGDLLVHLVPSSSWQDKEKLIELISALMPEFNLASYRDDLLSERVQLVMFSAVRETESHLETDGKLVRRPHLPLHSEGLEPFVMATQSSLEALAWDSAVIQVQGIAHRLIRSKRLLMGIAAAVIVFILYCWIVST